MARNRVDEGAVTRALSVLAEARDANEPMQTKGVALALYVLRGHCPDDWLRYFWDAAGTDHDIGRAQSMHAAYNGVELRVRGKDKNP